MDSAAPITESELDAFRQQWLDEVSARNNTPAIQTTSSPTPPSDTDSDSDSDSDTDSLPPEPPLVFNDPDTAVYGHLSDLVDAVTKGPPTRATTLVALHNIPLNEISLLKNLNDIAETKVLAELVDGAGKRYGATESSPTTRYQLRVTYNKLLLAPALRIECFFLNRTDVKTYLCISIDFHFNPFKGPDSDIQEYAHSANNIITFTANGASCEGFNLANLPENQARFGPKEREIIKYLSSFIKPEARHPVKLVLHDQHLTLKEKSDFAQLRNRLPGGTGHLLPSIGTVEYACYDSDPDRVAAGSSILRGPTDMMRNAPRHPMIPLPSSDTFRSVKEAGVELGYSALINHIEEIEAMQLWCSVSHCGTLLAHGNLAVVGMKFNKFDTLQSKSASVRYRLPNELSSQLKFKIPGKVDSSDDDEFKAISLSNTAGLKPGFDAYFAITTKPLDHFRPTILDPKTGRPTLPVPTELPNGASFDVRCEPHHPSFTFNSQMETVAQLQKEGNKRWLGILLNQVHDVLKAQDLTKNHGVSPEAKVKADIWLSNWMKWNAEQLAVIKGIRTAKGGLVLIIGPAGTGKTLLNIALSVYFYKLGFHVVSLSPANSNADHTAGELKKMKDRFPDLADVDFLRLFPSSRDHDIENMTEAQASKRTVGHEQGNALPLSEFLIAIDELDKEQSIAREYGVVEVVVAAALKQELVLKRQLRNANGVGIGAIVNVWDIVREFIDRYRNKSLEDKLGKYTAEQYRMAYNLAKGQIVGLSRYVVTTTGNVQAREMMDHYYSKSDVYGVPRVGVMVFVDEAAKDLEVNVWSGLVCKRWASDVKGAFLFCDDKQLKPTNTSASGDIVFNPFASRLDISLPSRLLREGFPSHQLVEQRRMHPSLAAFPNKEIYGGTLRSGPIMDDSLELRMPGFPKVLRYILRQSSSFTALERKQYREPSADTKLRLHWIEVRGNRVVHPVTKSSMVAEHSHVFFSHIYPKLRKYFDEKGQKMGENVMIICAYGYALHQYQNKIAAILASNPALLRADMPRVLTVDSSQGQESNMVIFDGSMQNSNRIGFVADRGRSNVAMTRAREVYWIIGGSMAPTRYCSKQDNLWTKYNDSLGVTMHSHKFP